MCWNLEKTECKEWQKGVVQDLSRLSFVGATSHLRRIHTPIPKGTKIRAPHSLHSTTWGMMCPTESPDGGNIGIIKHLSVLSQITFSCTSYPLRRCLIALGVLDLDYYRKCDLLIATKVFVNGDLMGAHSNGSKLMKQLRILRRTGNINIYTSVSMDYIWNELFLWTDEGRCTRPLLIVRDNDLSIHTLPLEQIKDKKIKKQFIGLKIEDKVPNYIRWSQIKNIVY